MSLAEEMLANVSLDNETTAYNTDDDEHIVVSESRDIIVPNSLKVIAVTGDKDVETVTFDCVRYWDGNDLSTFAIYLNYILPDGTTGTYIPESIRTSDGESIYHFDWLIQNNITKKSGKILFGVTAIKTKQNDSGEPIIEKQWSSFVNGDCSIAVGVDVSIVQDEEESGGIIAQLSKILENVPVRGEYLQDDVYFPSNRSPDDLKSSADVGFYVGNGYSLIVTEGSEYGDYNTIHQIKIVNTYTENGTPTIYIRQYYMGSAYSGTWTDWSQVGGDSNVIGQLQSYHHDNIGFVEDNLKTTADVGIYQGDTYTLLVTSTDSSYMAGCVLVNQLKFSYEGIKPKLYHRVYTSNGWSEWEEVGANEYNLTVDELTQVIPEGFGHSPSATSETFSNTNYYTYYSEGSLTNPNNMKAGDIVTLNITYGDGSTDTLTAERALSNDIDFGNGVTLSLSAHFVSADMGYEVTYSLSGINDVSYWSYTVTRISKINEKYLPESTNGKDGKSAYAYAQDGGYTGTEEEFAEDINPDNINDKANSFIVTELTKREQLKPEFANNVVELEASGDKTKLYVLPDGYIYAFGDVSETEEVVTNINTTFQSDIRISASTGEEVASDSCFCMDFIDISAYKYPLTIYLGGVEWYKTNSSTSNMVVYDENKQRIDGATFPTWKGTTTEAFQVIPNTDTNEVEVIFSGLPHNGTAIKYIRATAPVELYANAFVSASYTTAVDAETWYNTGHAFVPADYEERIIKLEEETENHESRIKLLEANEDNSGIPEYWLEELESKADTIQRAMESAGRNKSAFLWYTDAHWQYTNAKVSPMLMQYLIKNTSINKVNFGGDIVSDPSELTHEQISYVYEWRKLIASLPNHHSVIGNHDNLHKGRNDSDVSNLVYSFLIAPEESTDMVMGGDLYYYIDNPCEKTRYLYLDSGRFSLNDDETKFIIDSLTSVPDGWHIVVISHIWFQYTSSSAPTVGSINGHMQVVLNLLDAYNARESGSVTMSYTPNSYDFTSCGGRVEFCIGGHIHVDYDLTSTRGIPVILTASDTNQDRSAEETEDSGTLGTITESAVFGIIADYYNSKITVVGVGRGTSREIALS